MYYLTLLVDYVSSFSWCVRNNLSLSWTLSYYSAWSVCVCLWALNKCENHHFYECVSVAFGHGSMNINFSVYVCARACAWQCFRSSKVKVLCPLRRPPVQVWSRLLLLTWTPSCVGLSICVIVSLDWNRKHTHTHTTHLQPVSTHTVKTHYCITQHFFMLSLV